MIRKLLFLFGVGLSLLLVWFAVDNYRTAGMVAEENLSGTALSMAAAVETLVERDPSLKTLAGFKPPDVASLSLVDRLGRYRFHSNSDLIGVRSAEKVPPNIDRSMGAIARRITLRTGETVFEYVTPFPLSDEYVQLRLKLHTYRADAVVRRARLTLAVLLSLLGAAWLLVGVILRFARREEKHRLELTRREGLARLGEMGAMLAHEIRNHLAGIKGFAQLIERKPVSERNGEHAGRIVAEVRSLEELVNDLLAFARSDAIEVKPVQVRDLFSRLLSLMSPDAEARGVVMTSSCPRDLTVAGSSDHLFRLFLNLCQNALLAMPHGGSLHLAAELEKGTVSMRVIDTGEGMPPEVQERIFEPFFTTRARGTGLGLALCEKIARQHGGELRVVSTPGKGSVFTVTMRVAGVDDKQKEEP